MAPETGPLHATPAGRYPPSMRPGQDGPGNWYYDGDEYPMTGHLQ